MMKPSSLKEIKTELNSKSQKELVELCLSLLRSKKENKELLSYLLFESKNEEQYINNIKKEIDSSFESMNTTSYYFMRKTSRKILTNVKKHIRHSKKKETEVELLLYFCEKLTKLSPSIKKSTQLQNSLSRQLLIIKKSLKTLHEDLQYDYQAEIDKLENF